VPSFQKERLALRPSDSLFVANDANDNNIDSTSVPEESMDWPTDVLLQFLHALAIECDSNAPRIWHQLAFLTCKRAELARAARVMPLPIVLRIEFLRGEATRFRVPFGDATVVCIDVDWGDGTVDKLREKGKGFIEHNYASVGEYAVRVFPANPNSLANREACLDHLGFSKFPRYIDTNPWWRPIKEIVSLGNCGLRSLGYLFSHSQSLKINLEKLSLRGVCDLSGMFFRSRMNQPIGGWDVSGISNMAYLLYFAASFNHPIEEWDVSNVLDFSYMLWGASEFNQPIAKWKFHKEALMDKMTHQ
jgi:hypothetical protein